MLQLSNNNNRKANSHPFKIRTHDNEDGICTCVIQKELSPKCLESGICPSLKICAVFDGCRIGVAGIRSSEIKFGYV